VDTGKLSKPKADATQFVDRLQMVGKQQLEAAGG
jgi:hypothetical protein